MGIDASNRAGAIEIKAPQLADQIIRLVYWFAYRIHLLWAFFIRPNTEGVWVAVWCDGNLLVIKNSYRNTITLPGGGIDHEETPISAAVRELQEEVGIRVRPESLSLFERYFSLCEFKRDHINLFELELLELPHIDIDNREVSWAAIYSPENALKLNLFPALRCYLQNKLTESDVL